MSQKCTSSSSVHFCTSRTYVWEVLEAVSSWGLHWNLKIPMEQLISNEIIVVLRLKKNKPQKPYRAEGFWKVRMLIVLFSVDPGIIFITQRSCRLPEIYQFCIQSASPCGCKKETNKGPILGRYTYIPQAVILYGFVHFYRLLFEFQLKFISCWCLLVTYSSPLSSKSVHCVLKVYWKCHFVWL